MTTRGPRIGRLNLELVDIADAPFGYIERVEFTQALSGTWNEIGQQVVAGTTASVDLFVSVSGSDSTGDGSRSNPFATIQAAVDSLPRHIRHPTTITVDTGSYVGAVVPGFSIYPADPNVGAWLIVQGSMKNYATAQGAVSGAVTAGTLGTSIGTAWGTITGSSDIGWADDDLRGRWITFTEGQAAGDKRVVAWNFSSSLSVCGGFRVAPNSTSRFVIEDTATTIVPNTSSFANGYQLSPDGVISTTTSASFLVQGCTSPNHGASNNSPPNIIIQQFQLNARVIRTADTSTLCVRRCRGPGGSTAIVMMENIGPGSIYATDNVVSGSTASTCLVRMFGSNGGPQMYSGRNFLYSNASGWGPFNVFGDGGRYSSNGDYFVGVNGNGVPLIVSTTSTGMFNLSVNGVRVSGSSKFFGMNNAASLGTPAHTAIIAQCRFDDVATPIEMVGPMFASCTSLTGSGVTTFASISKGARLEVDANSFLHGGNTNGISIDGTTVSLATMRAGSPIHATGSQQAIFGTLAFQRP